MKGTQKNRNLTIRQPKGKLEKATTDDTLSCFKPNSFPEAYQYQSPTTRWAVS